MSLARCSSTPDECGAISSWDAMEAIIGAAREDVAIADSAYLADRDARHQEREDASADEVLAAWVDVDPTSRCLRVMRLCGEWSVVAMELGTAMGRGYGRCLESAYVDTARDMRRLGTLGVSGGGVAR